MAELLRLAGITKAYPGVVALDAVSFDLGEGEIHALMGENGAGKSTLVKIIAGVERPDAGSATISSLPYSPRSARDATDRGVATVYQELNLAANLTVAENICLGSTSSPFYGKRQFEARAAAAFERLRFPMDPRRTVGELSTPEQQMVAIARALDRSAKVLLLDEPTSSLDKAETRLLFDVVRNLRDDGIGIIFVTHFLDHAFEISDRITVLRNGKLAASAPTSKMPRLDLVAHMLGRSLDTRQTSESGTVAEAGTPIVEADALGRTSGVSGLSFTISRGEVVGFAGLLGSGRTETLRLLFGADSADQGELKVDGNPAGKFSPRRAINAGIGFCPDDRKTEGLVLDLSVRENVLLVLQSQQGWFRRLSEVGQNSIVDGFITSLGIAVPHRDTPVRNLSGGNQQKVLLARWLAARPRLLLLDEPTRGIDIGAKFEIAGLVQRLRDEGVAFAFVSSELEEVVANCTSIVVLRDRQMAGVLGATSETAVMEAIAGEASA